MYRVVVLIVGLMLAGMAQPSFGQDKSFEADRSTCLDTVKLNAEARIAVCTKMIESGRPEPKELAIAHFRRAYA